MFLTATDRAIRPVLEPGAIVSDDDCERMQAAEACTELGAEPAGKHRQSLLSRAWLRLVRWMA